MLHTIPEAQTVAMIEEVSSFFDETSESDLLNLFTEIDESDLSLLEDEGNTSNATTCIDSDSQSDDDHGDEENVNQPQSIRQPSVVPKVPVPQQETENNASFPTNPASSSARVEGKKRKLQNSIPGMQFGPLLPLFQPGLMNMMQVFQPCLNKPSSSLDSCNLLPTTSSSTLVEPSSKPAVKIESGLSSRRAAQIEKRELRMMKNRESANKSRMKRKNAVVGLEQEVAHLKNELQRVNEELAGARAENKSLKSHNKFLQNLLSKSTVPREAGAESLHPASELGTAGPARSAVAGGGGGGAALLAVGMVCCFAGVSLTGGLEDGTELNNVPPSLRPGGRVLMAAGAAAGGPALPFPRLLATLVAHLPVLGEGLMALLLVGLGLLVTAAAVRVAGAGWLWVAGLPLHYPSAAGSGGRLFGRWGKSQGKKAV